MLSDAQNQLLELNHNIYRMHSYVEIVQPEVDGARSGTLKRADELLRTSYARAIHRAEPFRNS